jgi:MFS family permease
VPLADALPALRSRNYRLFVGGQVVSYSGSWLQTVAQGWLVLELSNSPFIVGLVPAVSTLPILLFTLYGGVIADRVNRRRSLLILQTLLAVEALALAVLTSMKLISVGWVLVFAAFAGIISAFEVPIRNALVAELVPRESLMNAIALNSASFNLARVLGPAAAGAVIAIGGVASAFYLNAFSFGAVVWGLWRMRLPPHEPPADPPRTLEAFREGARYVRHEPWPRTLLFLSGITAMFGFSFLVVLPVFARDTLGTDASGYGALVASVGVGALVGALGLAAFGGRLRHRQRRLAIAAAVGFGLALIGAALTRGFWAALAILTGTGCLMVLHSISANTTVQQDAPDQLRGRVMGFYSLVVLGLAPFGSLQVGWVSEHFGVRVAYAIGGTICVVCALLAAWWLRRSLPRRSVT